MEQFQIFSYVGFSKDEKPYWSINTRQEVIKEEIEYNKEISLEFNKNQRHCIGWYDLETGENNVCEILRKIPKQKGFLHQPPPSTPSLRVLPAVYQRANPNKIPRFPHQASVL